MLRSLKVLFLAFSITCFVCFANVSGAEAPVKTLLVFGDSLVAGYGLQLPQAYPAVLEQRLQAEGYVLKVVNAGVSGDTTSGGLTRLAWTLEENPDYIMVELGANDMLRHIDPSVTRANLDSILRIIQDKKIPIILVGTKSFTNFGVDYFDTYVAMYKELARQYDAVLYPFFLEGVYGQPQLLQRDGLHPNEEGVKVMVENTLPYVIRLLKGEGYSDD